MNRVVAIFFLLSVCNFYSQHTFSIVAVDTLTGEIGSAGATCGDSIIWPGTPGAYIISDILPGVGAIHTQALWTASNQVNARVQMQQGGSPNQIISWLVAHDVQNNPQSRQYGVVDYHNGSSRSAAFTGTSCFDYKNHILGPNYAIQGNILLGQQILDSMEYYFLNTSGCLPEKLMAAMNGAKVIGADTRCMVEGTSSLSAFLRMALPTDNYNNLFLDINVAGTAPNVEPIDVLKTKYNLWKNSHISYCDSVSNSKITTRKEIEIHPNPTNDLITISNIEGAKSIELFSLNGQFLETVNGYIVRLRNYPQGIYILKVTLKNSVKEIKVIKN
ncbi:DUF1028 domain-containing protein [Bacteroidota bacterium]|nr:DUF1028 domain-containing protein [Bacteroidota bacterium]